MQLQRIPFEAVSNATPFVSVTMAPWNAESDVVLQHVSLTGPNSGALSCHKKIQGSDLQRQVYTQLRLNQSKRPGNF